MSDIISFVGIGSNLGDPVGNCRRAVELISSINEVNVLQESSLYRTEPVGFSGQDWFINCVIEAGTALSAHSLLEALQQIESSMGRAREARWGPRTIDLDILFYGRDIVEDDELVIPHPELHKRRFVLAPLCEIVPNFIHPVFGISVKEILDSLEDKSEVEVIKRPAT
ncbi:MAG: 2-amino-4-hydroxy-6-hydroxymethyldihydropteridine diphosphokinase [Proteobacteria bacterium]|nr:2-amino-4-hydroxy-6-hydroxymethyldihydropteridine diphosphokinase [Pseudomonadota bacterium]